MHSYFYLNKEWAGVMKGSKILVDVLGFLSSFFGGEGKDYLLGKCKKGRSV